MRRHPSKEAEKQNFDKATEQKGKTRTQSNSAHSKREREAVAGKQDEEDESEKAEEAAERMRPPTNSSTVRQMQRQQADDCGEET